MRFSITSRTRALLITISALAYVASLSDLSERLEAQGLSAGVPRATPFAARGDGAFVVSLVTRDPFEGAPQASAVRASAEPARAGDTATVADDFSPEAGDPGVLVPDIENAVADVQESRPESHPLIVRATLVGAHAAAYVASGDDLQLVHVGDVVGGRRIARIDVRGIAFSDGTRLDLSESYRATPEPRVTPRSKIDQVVRELARLRTTIDRRRAPVAEPSPSPAAVPERVASHRTPEPTAWPLPTVDSRGLPVGVNPTPDVSGPTAYPYPYPYPPPGPH